MADYRITEKELHSHPSGPCLYRQVLCHTNINHRGISYIDEEYPTDWCGEERQTSMVCRECGSKIYVVPSEKKAKKA
jgi:hypothetical protein